MCSILHPTNACAKTDWRCRARVTLARTPWRAHVACVSRLRQRPTFSHTYPPQYGVSIPLYVCMFLLHDVFMNVFCMYVCMYVCMNVFQYVCSVYVMSECAWQSGAPSTSSQRGAITQQLGSLCEEQRCHQGSHSSHCKCALRCRRVPKFSTYGSVCSACAQRPGLPRACHSG